MGNSSFVIFCISGTTIKITAILPSPGKFRNKILTYTTTAVTVFWLNHNTHHTCHSTVYTTHHTSYIVICLFTCNLFYDIFPVTEYIASKERLITQWWMGNYLDGSGRGLILRYYSGIRLEKLWNTTKTISQDNRSPGRDLKSGPPEYKAGLLTIRRRRSVHIVVQEPKI
jgi:hypothetical protein